VGEEPASRAHWAEPTVTTVHGASAGMSSPGSSFGRWVSSVTTTVVPEAVSRNAIACGANAVNSGT
jgi:hypothetical protein